jgi:pimeloyl-ACP methyl ester carboxylesterase
MKPRLLAPILVVSLVAACGASEPSGTPSPTQAVSTPAAATATPAAAATVPAEPSPPASPAKVEAVDFDLGSQELASSNGIVGTLPIQGTIAFPATGGPAPVAVLLHLRGNPCTDMAEELPCKPGLDARYDRGMAWLLTALAERGWIAVAPNITPTRDFRYEGATVELGWLVGDAVLTALKSSPTLLGAPAGVTASDVLATVGHSMGGDSAIWWAASRPDQVDATVMLEPAPSQVGLLASPANPAAFLFGTEQISRIPAGLPYAVVIGRCDADTGYQGGTYALDAAVQPDRTAFAALGLLPNADHPMLNTESTVESEGPTCPTSGTPEYDQEGARARDTLATWVPDVLDVATGRVAADGPEARRAGLVASEPADAGDLRVELLPPATARTTVMLPLAGALGPDVQKPRDLDNPAAGAATGTTYATSGLKSRVCLSGGTALSAGAAKPCALDLVEQPGDRGVLWLDGDGTWTATLPETATGTLLVTVSADPLRQPASVTITAGDQSVSLTADDLATPTVPAEAGAQRVLPAQVRLPVAGVDSVEVKVSGGVYLSNMVVAP